MSALRVVCRRDTVKANALVPACVGISAISQPAAGGFVQIDQRSLGVSNLHGITTDGSLWFVGHSLTNEYYSFDLDWNFLGSTPVVGEEIADLRAITFSEKTGSLFVGDQDNSVLYGVQPDSGEILSTLPTGVPGFGVPGLNAASINVVDGALWTAHFNGGEFRQFDTSGVLINSFADSEKAWTGLALDPVAQTIIALDADDSLHEYDFDGNLVANLPLPTLATMGKGFTMIRSRRHFSYRHSTEH